MFLIFIFIYTEEGYVPLFTEKLCKDVICKLIQQSLEKIDRVRSVAGHRFFRYIYRKRWRYEYEYEYEYG